MKQKVKMLKKCSILIIFMIMMCATAVSAYWSNVSTISYNRGDNYSQSIGIEPIPKTTNDMVAQFEPFGKSTWSCPKVCLVNSNNEERSGKVDLAENKIYTTSDVNTTINYYYYYKIIGAWNQMTTGKMDFRYNPY